MKGVLDPNGRKLSHWGVFEGVLDLSMKNLSHWGCVLEGQVGPQWEEIKTLGCP